MTYGKLNRLFALMADQGIRLGDAAILGYLAENRASEHEAIAAACRINPMTLRRYIRSLQERGLVSRVHCGKDRRCVSFGITGQGIKLISTIASPLS